MFGVLMDAAAYTLYPIPSLYPIPPTPNLMGAALTCAVTDRLDEAAGRVLR